MAEGIRAVLALGNPGAGHAADRHNVGFWFADELASQERVDFSREKRFKAELARLGVQDATAWLAKPWTYMNHVGESAAALARFHKLSAAQILVVHDELDLPPGTARFKAGGGHGGHNGLRDVTRVLGVDFKRLRIGIGHPGHMDAVVGHVLSKPGKSERAAIDESIERSVDAVNVLLADGWDRAAQKLNSAN
ncbi:aminoacyl-tRNA hydrolase [Salinisphaera sp. USBA-960]|uniref:aminoacyl-tRNA hydrolase n=1 Tax=Salinisphaera orenii TaxID=856731 RepID=UPI000DBE9296|nr:aminoacyl-tRNA hydrolase [Salifodinibacter halophilus]NNC25466.1 aminoacyl-tRNA hydrolase [Salifodinibacter halophilus]